MVKGLVPVGYEVQAKCSVVDHLRARCNVAVMDPQRPPGGLPFETVWFKLRQTDSGWSVRPDCMNDPQDVLCRHLRREAAQGNTVIPG